MLAQTPVELGVIAGTVVVGVVAAVAVCLAVDGQRATSAFSALSPKARRWPG